MKYILLGVCVSFYFSCFSQDQQPLVLTEDATYFNFWAGTWMLIKEDGSLDSTFYFKVKRSVHPAAFEEEWQFGVGNKSIAIRAWDKTTKTWGFVWVSANGLFQVWDTRKINKDWYIYKEFTIQGATYLSRQGFLLQPDGTVYRVSEKSTDEKSWELRFKQHLRKID